MSEHWFESTPEIDAQLGERFGELWCLAADGGMDHWRETADGALALVILFDQVPLNIFRGEIKSFSTEGLAREVSQVAIERGMDKEVDGLRRAFFYIPYMHSEGLEDQERSVQLVEGDPELEGMKWWANHHHGIIKRFGRFPHRNEILGRESTAEEVEWLASEDSFKG